MTRQRARAGQKGAFGYGRGAADMNRHFSDEAARSELETGIPAVEFLTTDLSDCVTAAVIPIDGGSVRGSRHPIGQSWLRSPKAWIHREL